MPGADVAKVARSVSELTMNLIDEVRRMARKRDLTIRYYDPACHVVPGDNDCSSCWYLLS